MILMKNIDNTFRLGLYRSPKYSLAHKIAWLFWGILSFPFESNLPGSRWRVLLLKVFGAKIGKRVVVKPGVKIKYPWRLSVGNDVWIGERVWIDNIDLVSIESNVCVSQLVYFCTGNHRWDKSGFDLCSQPIRIKKSSWIAAGVMIGPGVNIGPNVVISFGSIVTKSRNIHRNE